MAAKVSKETSADPEKSGLFYLDEYDFNASGNGRIAGARRDPRTIRASEYLSVRHALPKTNLTSVILYENTSHDRHLDMVMRNLRRRKEHHRNVFDLQRKTFLASQNRKQKKWRREDDVGLNGMNLPHLDGYGTPETTRPNSVHIMYRNPEYETVTDKDKHQRQEAALPSLVDIHRERTEIVLHRDKTFITKLPSMVTVNQESMRKHVKYCGKKFLDRSLPSIDLRFQRLATTLQPQKNDSRSGSRTDRSPRTSRTDPSHDIVFPTESPDPYERQMRRSNTNVELGQGLKQNTKNNNDDIDTVKKSGRSRKHRVVGGKKLKSSSANGRRNQGTKGISSNLSRSVTNVTDVKSSTRQQILEDFKSKDIKQLSRELTGSKLP